MLTKCLSMILFSSSVEQLITMYMKLFRVRLRLINSLFDYDRLFMFMSFFLSSVLLFYRNRDIKAAIRDNV